MNRILNYCTVYNRTDTIDDIKSLISSIVKNSEVAELVDSVVSLNTITKNRQKAEVLICLFEEHSKRNLIPVARRTFDGIRIKYKNIEDFCEKNEVSIYSDIVKNIREIRNGL